jgi:hypothetical protein
MDPTRVLQQTLLACTNACDDFNLKQARGLSPELNELGSLINTITDSVASCGVKNAWKATTLSFCVSSFQYCRI